MSGCSAAALRSDAQGIVNGELGRKATRTGGRDFLEMIGWGWISKIQSGLPAVPCRIRRGMTRQGADRLWAEKRRSGVFGEPPGFSFSASYQWCEKQWMSHGFLFHG
jgi:hypothetical protein